MDNDLKLMVYVIQFDIFFHTRSVSCLGALMARQVKRVEVQPNFGDINMSIIESMFSAGVHFGHQTRYRNPKMQEYIFATRNGVHILNLERTAIELEKTLKSTKALAASGKVILFVGTKQQARDIIKEAAISCNMPYLVER